MRERDGQEHGAGTRTFVDGEVQEGEFRDGQLHGWGRCRYASGGVYTGQWVGGVRSGRGEYCCGGDASDDEVYYVGEWKRDVQHGRGARVARDGSQYTPPPLTSTPHFRFKWRRFVRYVGEFKDGVAEGQGTLMHADGRIEMGTWCKGKLQLQQ